VGYCCKGDADTVKGIKARYYDDISKTFIPTRFDLGEATPKGRYKRKIYCSDNDKVYNTQMECSKDLNIAQNRVSNKLKYNKDCGFDLSYTD
jgi:uncharacterized protein (DUF2147 family)